jgi:drug/metabolite transporter (DMT)-like permease
MVVLGSSVPVSASLADYPVYAGQALRYVVAGLLLTALVWRRAGPRGLVPADARWSDVGWLAAVSGLGMVGFNICLVEACRRASPSLVGSVVGASPIVLALAVPLLRRRRPRARAVLAASVVAVGVVSIEGGGAADLGGLALAAGAMLGEVAFSLVALPLLGRWGALRMSAAACWVAALQLIALALASGEPLVAPPTRGEALALGYLAVMMTAVAFVLWYSGLERLGAERAGLFAGLVPIAATAVSVTAGTEPMSATVAAGTATVALGLLLGLATPTTSPAATTAPAGPGPTPAGPAPAPAAPTPAGPALVLAPVGPAAAAPALAASSAPTVRRRCACRRDLLCAQICTSRAPQAVRGPDIRSRPPWPAATPAASGPVHDR